MMLHAQHLEGDDGRYRLLLDSITDYAIYMLDAAGVVSSWNAGAERFKGYAAYEILGHHFSRFYTPEDRAVGAPARALSIAAREGRFEQEGWRVRKDGRRFWAHVVIDRILDPAGELIGYAKVTRDLTERHQAAEALRRSEQEFRLLVQSVTDYAIYMLDPRGRISTWNAGAERIKGYPPEEVIGQHFSRFYTPEDREAGLPQHGLDTAAREGRFEKEGWRVRKDGVRFWAHVVIEAVRDPTGQLIGFAKVTRDITERAAAQKALEQAQQALFQSQKMDAIGQLTGGVAHDFNNLLMAILGSLELVRKRASDDPKVLALIDNAIQGAERGASLTQRMLAFARRQELKSEAIDVAAVVSGLAGLLERSIGPLVRLETHFPEALPKVRADATQLEMALLNLAVNARDAMPAGGVVRVEASEMTLSEPEGDLAAGAYVRFKVSDTGEGMDVETLAKAAEPFFTTKGVGKGTGLGLSMVHGLAKQSGGDLRLFSTPGEGTTVELRLPVATGEEGPAARSKAPPPSSTVSGPLTILAVDDDPLVLMNTAAMLADLGHRVLEASSADEALAIIEAEPGLDLVISDQAMPRMTGHQLAEVARARRPDLPFILATGYAEIPLGADPRTPTLSKPFGQRDLAAAIGSAMPLTAPEA